MPEPFFPAESFYGQQTPFRFEAEVRDCEVVGEIPPCLYGGSYYRAGPDDAFPTLEGDNIINGDGRASAFHFREGGAVDFLCRYVKTERYLAEREARRRLFGKYRNPYTDDPSVAALGVDRDNTANTYALFHHGRLFMLREDSRPWMVDPETLETLEVCDFEGSLLARTLTAHPKVDPVTGEWWSFSLFAEKRYEGETQFQVIDRSGRIVRQESFTAPYPGVAHDFAVTRDHIIFPFHPLTVDKARMQAGGDFYAFDPSLPSVFGIMPRNGTTADLRWYEVPRAFFGHVMNAYSEGSVVHLDAAISPGNSFRFFKDVNGQPTDPAEGLGTITRLSFDLSDTNDHVTRTVFHGAMGEMPRIDDRFAMSRYRYGFTKTPGGIAMIDWDTMSRRVHSTLPGAPGGGQEPVFVPRSPDAAEGDGYVLCVLNRTDQNRADLVIIDTRNFEGPPQAVVRLPFNEPMSFHGGFASAADKRAGATALV